MVAIRTISIVESLTYLRGLSWLVNLLPLFYPPPKKYGFNKALLKETNG